MSKKSEGIGRSGFGRGHAEAPVINLHFPHARNFVSSGSTLSDQPSLQTLGGEEIISLISQIRKLRFGGKWPEDVVSVDKL